MGLTDSSSPRLAAGCRLKSVEGSQMVLFPEGALRVAGTGQRILALCDGRHTFLELISELEGQHPDSDAATIRTDTARFLEDLHDRRILDY
jgi:coenzyme PQQ biosynthesis protein PqqD